MSTPSLRIRVESADQRQSLLRFLEQKGYAPRPADELCVELEHSAHTSATTATLVALIEEWRSRYPTAETVLESGDSSTILRTEA